MDGSFVFLDFAFSLGFGGSWAGDGVKAFTPRRFPPRMLEALDNARIDAMIKKIEELDPDGIREVVHRIPERYLPKTTAEEIASGLLARAGMLRAEIDQYRAGANP